MPNTFDSIPQSITARALANNFTLEEKARREACALNKNFYYGNTTEYLNLFNSEVEPITVNYTKPLVSKRTSLLYSKKLKRVIEGPAESIAALETIYLENEIDNLMLKADMMSELTGSVLVMPVKDEEYEGGIKLIMWDGELISAVPYEDDPEQAESVSIVRMVDRLQKGWEAGKPQVERVLQQQVWTTDAIVKYDGNTLVATETNELGFIPFANFKGEEIYSQYIGFAPASLIRKLNHAINQKLTDLSYVIKMQSATPIVISGYQSGDEIRLTPGRAISLPAGVMADNIRLFPEIEETLNVIKWMEEKIYDTSSVPKISVTGGEKASSGKELLIRWYPLTNLYKEKALRWEKYEFELANMILAVLGLPEIDELNVLYPGDDNLPFSASDENLERDMRLGLTSPIKELMSRNADLDEDGALDELNKNIEASKSVQLTSDKKEETEDKEDIDKKENMSKSEILKLVEKFKE